MPRLDTVCLVLLLIAASLLPAAFSRPDPAAYSAVKRPAHPSLSSHPFPYAAVRGQPYKVDSDDRAIRINGERVLLQAGIIHYPRSTPDMWPRLMQLTKAANLNAVQTYVFWNYVCHRSHRTQLTHELESGRWDFSSDSRNLSLFIELAAAEGLFVNLRLGPYVCAEFAHGGLPVYLKSVPELVFRDYNAAWLNATRYYLQYFTRWLQPHLPKNGGPVILLQVENEYGDRAPNRYISWLSNLTVELNRDTSVVWYLNNQPQAPSNILAAIDAYNPAYYVNETARGRKQPAMEVESYTGWFEPWGNAHFHRAQEDHSMGFGEFYAAGGAYSAYYMWHGGTNFARWGGSVPGVMGYIPSYAYAAPLSENGHINPSKYFNAANFHRTIARYAATIINSAYAWPLQLKNISDEGEAYIPMPQGLFSYTIGSLNTSGSCIFLFNRDVARPGRVSINGQTVVIPYWTLYIIDGQSMDVVYDSNVMTDQGGITAAHPQLFAIASETQQSQLFSARTVADDVGYQPEPFHPSLPDSSLVRSALPIDQLLAVPSYTTSYLLYAVNVTVTDDMVRAGAATLQLRSMQDYLYLWLDDDFLLSSPMINDRTTLTVNLSSALSAGLHTLTAVTNLMGVINYTPEPDQHKGIAGGDISWGEDETLTDGSHLFTQQIGLLGETLGYQQGEGQWRPVSAAATSRWSWYRLSIATPAVPAALSAAVLAAPSYQLNMTAMRKGWMWVNGRELGLYWTSTTIPMGACQPAGACNRTGSLNADDPGLICQLGCGELYQRGLYHVPSGWLNAAGGAANSIVLFEEQEGADPAAVALQFWQSTED